MRSSIAIRLALLTVASMVAALPAFAATEIRIMPPNRSHFVVGQRFDIRVEATNANESLGSPPSGLRVSIDGVDVTASNVLDPGVGGERGAGGVGESSAAVSPRRRAGRAPVNSTNFFKRAHAFDRPGEHVISAQTADGASARVTVTVSAWQASRRGGRRVKNVILLLGDGMGAAHRTAARIVSHGVSDGKANGLLAMDTMEVTGQVMTFSLNSVITDSAPGMSAYVTGQKGTTTRLACIPTTRPASRLTTRASNTSASCSGV